MRILFVSGLFPDDPGRKVHGPFKRMDMFVDALKRVGHLDTLFFPPREIPTDPDSVERYRRTLSERWGTDIELSLCPRQEAPDEVGRWEAYVPGIFDCYRQWGFHWMNGPRQLEAFERALERRPDAVFVQRLAAMCPAARTDRPLPPVFLDLDDVEHVAFARSVGQPPVWPAKRLQYLQVPALWWGERRAIARSRRTFVCSERDRRYLERTMRVSGVAVVPNAVEMGEPQPVAPEPTLMFLGSLSYGPNANAAAYLADRIWPLVREAVPDARLIIAGRHPGNARNRMRDGRGVEFTGFVEDLPALYRRTRVVCIPILSGGGTRVKVIEAARFGKPIVSTSIGAEGLELEDGRDLLIRDDPAEFAAACVRLLGDAAACRALGRAAHDTVAARYDRERVVGLIEEHVRTALSEAPD